MAALLLFFQDISRTPSFVLGENTKRSGKSLRLAKNGHFFVSDATTLTSYNYL
jgi:hypothetical protein